MTWEQIRATYPDRWVLMEPLKSHIEGDRHIFEELSVLDTVPDGGSLFPRYRELRREFPGRDIVFYHASNPRMEIKMMPFAGVRAAR